MMKKNINFVLTLLLILILLPNKAYAEDNSKIIIWENDPEADPISIYDGKARFARRDLCY